MLSYRIPAGLSTENGKIRKILREGGRKGGLRLSEGPEEGGQNFFLKSKVDITVWITLWIM